MEDEAIWRHDPFAFMSKKLQASAKKGIRPVIIIDEIQTLKHIYTNGEQYLVDKLFNLFIRLTKELTCRPRHPAHLRQLLHRRNL